MKNPRRKKKNSSVVLDVVACALSAVSVGLSVAAFVISLAKKKIAEKWKKLLTGGESLWYSIKAVAERRGGRTEKIWKEWKKFLTNGFEFDILNKLFRKRQRSEKFEFWKKCFKNFEKVLKKFLTNEKQSDIINKLSTSGKRFDWTVFRVFRGQNANAFCAPWSISWWNRHTMQFSAEGKGKLHLVN